MARMLIGASVLLLAGCVSQAPLYKQTQSGKAEATMPGVTVAEFRNEIILGCTRNGMEVDSSGTNSVTCSKREEGGKGLLAQALLGNPYTDPPYTRVRFTFAQTGNDVFVVADPWLEIQKGFGQVDHIPITNVAMRNDLQRGLDVAAENARKRKSGIASDPPAATSEPCASCATIGHH